MLCAHSLLATLPVLLMLSGPGGLSVCSTSSVAIQHVQQRNLLLMLSCLMFMQCNITGHGDQLSIFACCCALFAKHQGLKGDMTMASTSSNHTLLPVEQGWGAGEAGFSLGGWGMGGSRRHTLVHHKRGPLHPCTQQDLQVT